MVPASHKLFGPNETLIFQQDNAPSHTAIIIKDWFARHNVSLTQAWPARSPDLNIIENMWSMIDRNIMKSDNSTKPQLKEAIEREYKNLSQEYIQNLFLSFHNRCKLVPKNRGGHIAYQFVFFTPLKYCGQCSFPAFFVNL